MSQHSLIKFSWSSHAEMIGLITIMLQSQVKIMWEVKLWTACCQLNTVKNSLSDVFLISWCWCVDTLKHHPII